MQPRSLAQKRTQVAGGKVQFMNANRTASYGTEDVLTS